MIYLYGPKNARYTYTGSPVPHLDLAYCCKAHTLAEALSIYENVFNARVTPMHEPLLGLSANIGKYFDYLDLDTGVKTAVDVHVVRQGQHICPKQNLAFELQTEDIVDIGPLIC